MTKPESPFGIISDINKHLVDKREAEHDPVKQAIFKVEECGGMENEERSRKHVEGKCGEGKCGGAVENEESATSLSAEQKVELVGWMDELIARGEARLPQDAAYMALENVAGFETAPEEVVENIVNELVSMYERTYAR